MESGSSGPQSPAPGGDEPKGPQSPAGSTAPPPNAGAWAPPVGSQPSGPQSPPLGGQQAPPAPPFGGQQMPPGGWQQPVAPQPFIPAQGQLASWGSRFGAYLLDWLIVFAIIVIGSLIVAAVRSASGTAAIVVGIPVAIALLVVFVGYWSVLTARSGRRNGQTWGKQIVGIRVVRDDGRPVEFGTAVLREFVLQGIVIHLVPFVLSLVNYLWPLWDDTERALHDMACSTHVVQA